MWFKVSDLSKEISKEFPNSQKEEGQKTWQDLETTTWNWSKTNDNQYFIDVNALCTLKGSEIVPLLTKATILTLPELKPFLISE
jgi:5-methylcytosine-specific restriction endonuclease McrA